MVQRIEGSNGDSARYLYNREGYLIGVDTVGHSLRYNYDERNQINRVVEDDRVLEVHYDHEGRAIELDLGRHVGYHIRYGGEAVEVSAPDGEYVVKPRGSYFEVRQYAREVAGK